MNKSLDVLSIVSTALKLMGEKARVYVLGMILNGLEDMIEKSETKFDDEVILPIIQAARARWDIPDNDEPAEDEK